MLVPGEVDAPQTVQDPSNCKIQTRVQSVTRPKLGSDQWRQPVWLRDTYGAHLCRCAPYREARGKEVTGVEKGR
jgi:hypothetical protein